MYIHYARKPLSCVMVVKEVTVVLRHVSRGGYCARLPIRRLEAVHLHLSCGKTVIMKSRLKL